MKNTRFILFAFTIAVAVFSLYSCKKDKDINDPFNNYYTGNLVLEDSVLITPVEVYMRNGNETNEVRFTINSSLAGWNNLVLNGPIYTDDFIIPSQGNRLNTIDSEPRYIGRGEKRDKKISLQITRSVTGSPDETVYIYADGQ